MIKLIIANFLYFHKHSRKRRKLHFSKIYSSTHQSHCCRLPWGLQCRCRAGMKLCREGITRWDCLVFLSFDFNEIIYPYSNPVACSCHEWLSRSHGYLADLKELATFQFRSVRNHGLNEGMLPVWKSASEPKGRLWSWPSSLSSYCIFSKLNITRVQKSNAFPLLK